MEINQKELIEKAKKCVNDIVMGKMGDKLFINGNINTDLLKKLAPVVAKKIIETGKIKIKVQQETSQSEGGAFEKDDDLNWDEIEVDGIRMSEDGELIIPQSPEEFVEFIVKYMINEIDSINNAIGAVMRGMHDDRIALVDSALTKYKKALNTNNEKLRLDTIRSAEDSLTDAMAKICKEVGSNVETLSNIPKNLIGKLFCGIKPDKAEQMVNLTRESLVVYEQGLHLMLRLDVEMNETNRIVPSLSDAREFLKNTLQNDKAQRIYELSGDDFWIKKPNEIIGKINQIEQTLLAGKQTILIEAKGA